MARLKDNHDDLVHPSRLKIQRAKKHINDLHSVIEDYLSQRPFSLWSRFSKNPNQRQIFVKQDKPIPDEVPLMLGDAIHNLKCALDMLAYGMVSDIAPKPERVLFPFADTEQGLQGSIANRQVHLAGEKVIRAIKGLKPYADGDNLLYSIQVLDTRDKHHFIITTAQVAEITGDHFGFITGLDMTGPGIFGFEIPLGEPIITLRFGGTRAERRAFREFEREDDFQPSFAICFPPEDRLSGRPVVETLIFMTETVENAVEKIAEAFFDKT